MSAPVSAAVSSLGNVATVCTSFKLPLIAIERKSGHSHVHFIYDVGVLAAGMKS